MDKVKEFKIKCAFWTKVAFDYGVDLPEEKIKHFAKRTMGYSLDELELAYRTHRRDKYHRFKLPPAIILVAILEDKALEGFDPVAIHSQIQAYSTIPDNERSRGLMEEKLGQVAVEVVDLAGGVRNITNLPTHKATDLVKGLVNMLKDKKEKAMVEQETLRLEKHDDY